MNKARNIVMNLQMFAGELIDRQKAEAIIREQVVEAIQQDLPKQSTFLAMAKKLPNMTSNQTRIRVLDMLPTAYWKDGDTGYIKTSEQAWENVYITAGELAVIVPIPKTVLDDAEFDIMGEVTPRCIEAMGQKIDGAIVFGINRPAEWQNDIITLARQAGNNVALGASPDYYEKILCENGVFAKVEENDYTVSGIVASNRMKAKLRGVRDQNGAPIFKKDMQGTTQYALDGVQMLFPDNGAFDNKVAQMVVGDFSKAVYAIRNDVDVKILTEAVIQDPTTGAIVYNLAQQDMIAIRITFRMGWAVPNPATRMDENRVSCPFAYLEPATPVTTQAVTFTVKDDASPTPAALEGAKVNVNGSNIMTDASGKAVFNLRAGTYPYAVTMKGKVKVTGAVTVASSAVSQEVTLIANA